jgi:hypothetical protein
MDSVIYTEEVVENTERKFGSWSEQGYYPAFVIREDGTKQPALFTKNQIETAVVRAKKNPEDMPEEEKNLWEKLFGG